MLVKIRRFREGLKLLSLNKFLSRDLSEAIDALSNGLVLSSALVLGRILKIYLHISEKRDEKFNNFINKCFNANFSPRVSDIVEILEVLFKNIIEVNSCYEKAVGIRKV